MDNRSAVISDVQDSWDRGDHDSARDLLVSLELDDLARDEQIVQNDLRLYREGTKTIVPDQRMVLAHYIAIHNRCETMVTTVERGADASRFIRMIGFLSDVETDRLLYRSLVSEMLSSLSSVDVDGMRSKQADEAHAQFCEQFAWTAHTRLDDVKNLVERSAKRKGLAAKLKDRADLVKARYREMFPNVTTLKRTKDGKMEKP